MVSLKISFILLTSVTVLTAVVLYLLKPIPQLQTYHDFADQKNWLGIPNAWNVLSNIGFAVIGLGGLFVLFFSHKAHFNDWRERWIWTGVFIGLILTAMGSTYYHIHPSNSRLVWDRLPMTVVFMSLVAALISEKMNIYLGLGLWPILLSLGVYSVLLWYEGELHGNSDLRFYIGVQIFTLLVVMVMLLSPSQDNRNWDLAIVLASYGFAILFDWYDHQIYKATGEIISGHTLKHLVAALAGAWLVTHLTRQKRNN